MTLPPNPPPPPRWATEIEDRSPRFKLHRQWSHVRAAIGLHAYSPRGVRGGKVYEWVDDTWKLIHDIPPGTPKHEHEFFLGMDGGPQDVEKMARARQEQKLSKVKRLQQELAAAQADLERSSR